MSKNNRKLAKLHIITLKTSFKKNNKYFLIELHSLIVSISAKLSIKTRGIKKKLGRIFKNKFNEIIIR